MTSLSWVCRWTQTGSLGACFTLQRHSASFLCYSKGEDPSGVKAKSHFSRCKGKGLKNKNCHSSCVHVVYSSLPLPQTTAPLGIASFLITPRRIFIKINLGPPPIYRGHLYTWQVSYSLGSGIKPKYIYKSKGTKWPTYSQRLGG